MNKNNLTITISGVVASGKSRLTYFLKEFLKKEGFNIEFEGNLDHPTEHQFDKTMSKNIDEIIDDFKKTKNIKIVEKQEAITRKKNMFLW